MREEFLVQRYAFLESRAGFWFASNHDRKFNTEPESGEAIETRFVTRCLITLFQDAFDVHQPSGRIAKCTGNVFKATTQPKSATTAT